MADHSTHEEASNGCKHCTFYLYCLFTLLALWLTSGYVKSAIKALKKIFVAHFLYKFSKRINVIMMPHKQRLFEPLREMAAKAKERGDGPLKLVEIGAGSGANFKYFPEGTEVTCIEPNDRCEAYLRRTVVESGNLVTLAPVRICGAEIMTQSGALQENSVDAVVGTLVLCSVNDARQVLQQVLKILKPGGKYFFIEHIAAKPGTRTRAVQDWVGPVVHAIFHGSVHMESDQLINRAGFSEVQMEIVELPELTKVVPAVFRPMMSLATRNAFGTGTK